MADDEIEIFPVDLPLDPATAKWLARLGRVTQTHPRDMIASMLRDIRIDDEEAHRDGHTRH
jgi:hypothetical protein